MTLREIVTIVLSTGLFTGVVMAGINYLIDLYKTKENRSFEIKRDAYTRAAVRLAGMSHGIFNSILKCKKESDGKIDSVEYFSYRSDFLADIAPAIMVADPSTRSLLKKIDSLIREGVEAYDAPTKNKGKNPPITKWRKKADDLENQTLASIQRDLGLTKD